MECRACNPKNDKDSFYLLRALAARDPSLLTTTETPGRWRANESFPLALVDIFEDL